jgi:hypothetical protein
MRFIKADLDNLTTDQKDKLDCHQLIKTRYSYTGQTESHIEASNPAKCAELEVPPRGEVYTHIRYFQTTYYRNDQGWEKPTLYHYIGEVEFYSVTTYSDKRTKIGLRATGNTTRPVIHYRYQNRKGQIESVGEDCLGLIALRVKEENKTRRLWRENLPVGEVYRDPYFEHLEDGDSDTEAETDEEEIEEVHRILIELDSDTDSEDLEGFQFLVDQVPTDDLEVSQVPSLQGILELVKEQEKKTGVKRKQFDCLEAYKQEPL